MNKNENKNLNEIDELIPNESINMMMEELKEEAHQQSADEIKEEKSSSVEKKDYVAILKEKFEHFKTFSKEKSAQVKTIIKEKKSDEPKDVISKFKLYFVSDMDEEAQYLHEMSVKGMHFMKKEGIRYIFKVGEPENNYYHIGYYEKDKRDGERYLENYKEAGWESVYHEKAEFDGVYHYFVTTANEGEEPNIFSDKQSRMSLYKRLLTAWRSLIAMLIICLAFMIFCYYFVSTHPTSLQTILTIVSFIVIVALAASLATYLRIYFKINKKLNEFKYE